MNIYKTISGIVLIVGAAIALIIRLKRVKWFNDHYQTRKFERFLGKKGVDVYYIIVTIILIIMGLLVILNII
jgi:hypothetical protein